MSLRINLSIMNCLVLLLYRTTTIISRNSYTIRAILITAYANALEKVKCTKYTTSRISNWPMFASFLVSGEYASVATAYLFIE